MFPSSTGERFRVVTPDGLELAAERHGNVSGPEVLLVHGLGQSRMSWSRQTEGTLAETCHIVSYDLRGHGDSSKPASVAAYSDRALWAADLRAVIEASGFTRPTVVGWSLGALVVGYYLHRYGAGDVSGVNAIAPVAKQELALIGLVPIAHREALAAPDLTTCSDAIASFLAACFVALPPEDEFRRMLVVNGMASREMQEAMDVLGDDGLDEVWASLPRLLATWGDEDRLIRRGMSDHLLAINPAARLSVYEGVGHAPFYERPERFNRELAAFAAG